MDQCEVCDAEDIDTAIKRIQSQKAMVTQVRAIMLKVSVMISWRRQLGRSN